MSDFFVGEIRAFPFGLIPRDWLPCQGQQLQVRQYAALFALLGTTYGGDGRNTFNLPDLRGRVPMSIGPTNPLGLAGGKTTATLTSTQVPMHTHLPCASAATPPTQATPLANTWAGLANGYGSTADAEMSPQVLSAVGGGQPHSNMQPYLTLSLCIATTGIFPPRQ